MRTYRWGSAFVGALYVALAVSISTRPPQPLPGQVTVFERIFPAGLWTVAFVAAAVLLLITAATAAPRVYLGHLFALPVAAAFAVANLDISIENGTGWQLAAAFAIIACCHFMLLRLRPLAAL